MFDILLQGAVAVLLVRIMINYLLLMRRYSEAHAALSVQLHGVDVGLLAQLLQTLLLHHQVKLARLLSLQHLLCVNVSAVEMVKNADSVEQSCLVDEVESSSHFFLLFHVVLFQIMPVPIGNPFVFLHHVPCRYEIQKSLLFALFCVLFQAIENFTPELVIGLEKLPRRVPVRKTTFFTRGLCNCLMPFLLP